MTLFSIKISCLATIGLLALLGAACSSGSDSNDTGATTGTGGTVGGAAPTAGAGAGGAGGGAAAPRVLLWTFTNPDDALAYTPGNATATNDLTTASTFSWDSVDGAPDLVADAGSMRIQAPFSAYTQPDQAVDFQFMLPTQPMDLTGKTLFLYLKLDSGFSPDPSAPGGLMFYAKSNDTWDWGQAPWMNIDPTNHNWRKYTFDLSKAESAVGGPTFDPANVMSIGIKLDTGTPQTTPPPAAPAAATFHLDTIGYQ
jgi:hypothetical protein